MTASRVVLILALFLAALGAVCGCGVSSPGAAPPPTPSKPAASPGATLGGNWLLFGTMPSFFPSATAVTPGLAVSFDVENGKIIGAASLQQACTSGLPFGEVYESILAGNVNPDGTFTLGIQPAFNETFTMSGTVPTTAGAPWTGSYVIANPYYSAPCAYSLSGTFTAVPVADLTGTFRGTGSLVSYYGSGLVPAASAPISVTQTLKQRGDLPSTSGSPAFSDLVIGGDLQITGIPCFSKGTPSTFFSSLLIGNQFDLHYDMDDGSQLTVLGVIDDPATTKLSIDAMLNSNGKCTGTYEFNAAPLVLAR